MAEHKIKFYEHDCIALGIKPMSHCWIHRAIKEGKLQATLRLIDGTDDSHRWMIAESDYIAWRSQMQSKRGGTGFTLECADEEEYAEVQKALKIIKAKTIASLKATKI